MRDLASDPDKKNHVRGIATENYSKKVRTTKNETYYIKTSYAIAQK